jgi:hypothetical protein
MIMNSWSKKTPHGPQGQIEVCAIKATLLTLNLRIMPIVISNNTRMIDHYDWRYRD